MSRTVSACLLALLLAASCMRTEHNGKETIDLVVSIAGNPESPDRLMLESLSKVPANGDIYILGAPRTCGLIGESFLANDSFDNVRARLFSDGLKDFAGETFALVEDAEFSPYSEFVELNGGDALRELSVRLALSSLRDKCNASIYDIEGNEAKARAKMLILADPWMLNGGKFDIDTLFSLTSCRVPVISPQELLIEAAFAGEKKYFNVGMMCDSVYVGTGVYHSIYEAGAAKYDIMGTRYFEAASSGDEGHRLAAFLDRYSESGKDEPLDVLLVDDWSVDKEALMQELALIRDYTREEFMRYGKMISPDFTIFSSAELTMHYCYRKLRALSLFTHRIALPDMRVYTIKPQPGGSKLQFLLIPSENVQG